MKTTKAVIAAACFLLFAGLAGAAPFNFGISPTKVDKGIVEPGSNFYVSFYAISDSPSDITFDITTAQGDIPRFDGLTDAPADQFSAQGCQDCIRFLKGGGELKNQDSQSGDIQKWKAVEFLVSVPEDAEPGYHLLEITPEPQLSSSGGGGGVDVVSATTLPVFFRVPGAVDRSGKIIGLRAGRNLNGRQEIEATYYNTGTVTTDVDLQFRVETLNGTETLRAASEKVAPGETTQFTSFIDADELNATFQAAAIADYYTGETVKQADLEKKEISTAAATGRVTEETPETSFTMYLLVLAFLALSTTITWMVVRHLQ